MMRVELETREEVVAGARSRLYRVLANGFGYPDQALFGAIQGGRYREDVEEASQPLPYDLTPGLDGLVACGPYLDFQAQYLRIFEVGLGVPPCPLYGGLYRGGRKAVMEELTRFYNFFGLSAAEGKGELPDHVGTELEFMHFLAFRELVALDRQEDAAPYRRAQADFLERQLVSWLSALEQRLERLDPPPFYVALVWLARTFAQAELEALRRAQPVAVEA